MIAANYSIFGRKYTIADPLWDKLVAYYPLDGNSIDVINAHNGVDTNITYVAGKDLQAAQFNGTTSRIDIPISDDFTFSNGVTDIPFSVSAWVFRTALGTQFIVGDESIVKWTSLFINNKIRVTLYGNPSALFIGKDTVATFPINVWQHIVITYNGNSSASGIKIYVDNVLQPTTNIGAGAYLRMSTFSKKTLIGAWQSGTYTMNGKVDALAIWKDRELSALDVAELYNSGDGKFYNVVAIVPPVIETHVFLAIGQSNMLPQTAGTGSSNPLTYDANMFQWGRISPNNNVIIPATKPLQHYDYSVNNDPGLITQFMTRYRAANPTAKILIIPSAKGSTSFDANNWNQGNAYYNDAVTRTNLAMTQNPTFIFKGILWHQGESDQNNLNYQLNLDTFISNIRTDINVANSNTPFVLGGHLNAWHISNANRTNIQNIVKDTPNRVVKTAFASSDLPTVLLGQDYVHFSSDASIELGNRYYDAYNTLL